MAEPCDKCGKLDANQCAECNKPQRINVGSDGLSDQDRKDMDADRSAWSRENDQFDSLWCYRKDLHNGELLPQLRDFARAVLAASKQEVMMTDEQIMELADQIMTWGKVCYVDADKRGIVAFARALLSASKPATMDKQEAVYYRYRHSEQEKWHYGTTPQNWWECQPLGVITTTLDKGASKTAVPDGYKLVPVEPTLEMQYAGIDNGAPQFDAKHISLKTRSDGKIVLTLLLDGVEGAPNFKVIPVNPSVIRAAKERS